MPSSRDVKIPLNISLHARALLAQEKRGYIDSIVLTSDFTGEFYSFLDLEEPRNINICGQSYPLFSRKVYFKGQPIGLFVHQDTCLIDRYESSTYVYYSQDESFFPKLNYKTSKAQSSYNTPLERIDDKCLLLEKKTTLRPVSKTQAVKKRATCVFEYKREGLVTLWIPCNLSSWLKEAIEEAFPSKIYGKISLKPTYPRQTDINLSLLFIFLCQLLFAGLKIKKNILLHLDLLLLKSTSQPSISLSSFHQPGKSSSPLFYQVGIVLPFSLRWCSNFFKKAIKDFLKANLSPNKISITLSEPLSCPLFYCCIEDILRPLSDLVYEHTESHLKDLNLTYYHKNYINSSKRKLLLNFLLKQSDFLRKDYSYSRQENFCDQKFSFPSKKGIGLCLIDLGLELSDCDLEVSKDSLKKINTFKNTLAPLHSASFSIFQNRLGVKLSLEEGYRFLFNWEKTYVFQPIFQEAYDWLLDSCSCEQVKVISNCENSSLRETLTFKTNLKSYPLACVVELKGETWIHEIEIVNICIVMQKGRKDHKELERERVLSMIEYFLSSELPKHIKIINKWSKNVSIHILEEGSGSFVSLPYALKNAFFSALQQTKALLDLKEIHAYERSRQYGEFF